MPDLPTGTITFLFTDVEGSTRLWERHPAAMRPALARHDALIGAAVEQHGGVLVRPRGEGDSRFAVFARASDAVTAACAMQEALHTEPWSTPEPLRVRVALHTGEADLRGGDYYGTAVNRCARLRAIAHGGQVLLSARAADLARDALPDEVDLRDLGLHRLQDLAEPEHVYQLTHPTLPAEFPPLRSLSTLPHNLPVQLTSFVGRERELDQVKELFAATRLLTLTGPGGTGKTRLALQVAADLLGSFPDGAFFVDLAPLMDPSLVPTTVTSALAITQTPGQPPLESLKAYCRDKSLLLVLDNCEHLVQACAQLVDALLRTCPELKVLATSREALGIAGETTWRVPPLASPDPDAAPPLTQLTQYEAVRLFIERAVAVKPDFQVTNANAPAVAQLCARLDGIPLAIELAAARVRVLSVEQICDRLADRFRLLTGGSRTALPRQQTLRALVDWSYALLGEPERLLFRRLSVFAGGFSLEAAEAICAGDGIETYDVLDLLTSLVDKSLVLAEEQSHAVRYRLLETLRQYSRERLAEDGATEPVQRRHAEFLVAFAEHAASRVLGGGQAAAFASLEMEQDNFRAALGWCISSREVELGLRLASALWWVWSRYQWAEGRRWLDTLLALPGQERTVARAQALGAAGTLAAYLGEYDAGRRQAEASVALARDIGDQRVLALLLTQQALTAHLRGDRSTARSSYDQALALARHVGLRWVEIRALSEIGDLLADAGDLPAARAHVEEALRIARDAGDAWSTALALNSLGDLARHEGDYRRARALYEEALARMRESHWDLGWGSLLHNMGYVELAEGTSEGAAAYFRESLDLFRAAGDRRGVVECVVGLASVATVEDHPEQAARLFGAAEAAFATLGTEMWPSNRHDYARYLGHVRAALSEDAFQSARCEGRALALDEAVALAMA